MIQFEDPRPPTDGEHEETASDGVEMPSAGTSYRVETPELRWGLGAGVLAMIALAVWGLSQWSSTPNASDELLVQDSSGTVSLLDLESGGARYELPDAVVAPDRSSVLTARADAGTTRLESRDPNTGEVTGATSLLGDQQIRAVSPKGGAVALMAPRPPGLGLYEPESRTTTEIAIAFTDDRPAQYVTLDGNYEPETFSLDERTLYVLEFDPPTDPTRYYVRELDLESESVAAVKTPQVDIRPEMRGVARAQAVAPDGASLYTLYTIPPDADPVHDPADAGDSERWAFVHVLDLDQGFDFCIFLPVPVATRNEATVGIGLSPDGRTLYVVDPSTSHVLRIDAEAMEITGVYVVPEILDPSRRADVAVADDGTLYVGLGTVVHELDPSEDRAMTRVFAWNKQATTSGLTVSKDGRQLRFAHEGRVFVVDRATREELMVIRAPDGSDLEILGPPSGTVVAIPLECAC